jgi:pimeloyl-ACP methyl ester carboxylesterase
LEPLNIATIPEVRFRTVDSVRIRYADSGGSHEPTIMLTSPWPESLYAFTPIWETLARHAACSPSTFPTSASQNAATSSSHREPWADS